MRREQCVTTAVCMGRTSDMQEIEEGVPRAAAAAAALLLPSAPRPSLCNSPLATQLRAARAGGPGGLTYVRRNCCSLSGSTPSLRLGVEFCRYSRVKNRMAPARAPRAGLSAAARRTRRGGGWSGRSGAEGAGQHFAARPATTRSGRNLRHLTDCAARMARAGGVGAAV
eukprot:365277-Chlamydomonas_euryale.AAC.18